MKIIGVQGFQYDAAFAHGDFGMSRGRFQRSHRSLVVRVTTDEGLVGWGETSPHGPTYLPSFFEGEVAALRLLANAVVGLDPRDLGRLNLAMDGALLSGNAAKSALDIACWDILGQSTGLPVAELLGGRLQDCFPVFLAVPVMPLQRVQEFVERELVLGVRVFQVKVGDVPHVDVARVRAVVEAVGPDAVVIADANGGWNLQSALLAVRQLEDLPVRLEQPCRTMADCAELRKHTSLPLILDECVNNVEDLMLAKLIAGAGGVNVKPGRLGGFTKARALRDAAQGLGMTFTIDDTWGGAIVTAQNAHMAASSHPGNLTAASFFSEWVEPLVASGPRMNANGTAHAPTAAGLGIKVDQNLLVPAVIEI